MYGYAKSCTPLYTLRRLIALDTPTYAYSRYCSPPVQRTTHSPIAVSNAPIAQLQAIIMMQLCLFPNTRRKERQKKAKYFSFCVDIEKKSAYKRLIDDGKLSRAPSPIPCGAGFLLNRSAPLCNTRMTLIILTARIRTYGWVMRESETY